MGEVTLLLSMTGHGEAHGRRNDVSVVAEIRAINSRHFKLSMRAGECFLSLEPRVEAVVRKRVRRGTVLVNLKVDRESSPDHYCLNDLVLQGYRSQLEQLCRKLPVAEPVRLEALLTLPGVVEDRTVERECTETDWPLIEEVLGGALDHLCQMRREEGRAMAEDLESNCQAILDQLNHVVEQAPRVIENYRSRLTERINALLREYEKQVEPAAMAREVGLMAERSDISEELVRLRSHIDQFRAMMQASESNGRKLDFLTQEMFRESNTIGSKANDAGIAARIVEVKAMIERMREMVQNVE